MTLVREPMLVPAKNATGLKRGFSCVHEHFQINPKRSMLR